VLCFDGPAGEPLDTGEESALDKLPPRVVVKRGSWPSDATKRTAMVRWVQERYGPQNGSQGPLWGLWVDGDELLLNGRWLPDLVERAKYEQDGQAGGIVIRLVEQQDGSVARCHGKLIRIDAIDRYEVSSYQVLYKSGHVLALPNVPEDREHWASERAATGQLFALPPYPGEPHLVHRSQLRPPERGEVRLHKAEGDWFTKREDVQAIERRLGIRA
jgi:hypothetical protein